MSYAAHANRIDVLVPKLSVHWVSHNEVPQPLQVGRVSAAAPQRNDQFYAILDVLRRS
jgi:hypothetical protein